MHPSSIRLSVTTTRFSIKKKVEEGWIFKNLLKVRLEAMQRELQENPHDEANKAAI